MKCIKRTLHSLFSLLKLLLQSLWTVIKITGHIFFWVFYYATRLLTLPFRLCFAPKDMSELSGIDFEHFIAKWLSYEGYRNIKTTGIGADYGIDILAIKDDVKIGIQCKRYSKSVGVSAIQEVSAGLPYYECEKGIVITNSDFTKNAVELALSNGVELIDGEVLRNSHAAQTLLYHSYALYLSIAIMACLSLFTLVLDFFILKTATAYLPLTLLFTLLCILSLLNGISILQERKKEQENAQKAHQ